MFNGWLRDSDRTVPALCKGRAPWFVFRARARRRDWLLLLWADTLTTERLVTGDTPSERELLLSWGAGRGMCWSLYRRALWGAVSVVLGVVFVS
jgi:hypothetical protein